MTHVNTVLPTPGPPVHQRTELACSNQCLNRPQSSNHWPVPGNLRSQIARCLDEYSADESQSRILVSLASARLVVRNRFCVSKDVGSSTLRPQIQGPDVV